MPNPLTLSFYRWENGGISAFLWEMGVSRNRPQASGFSSGLSPLPLMFPSPHVSDPPAIFHNTLCEKEVAGDTLFPDNPLGGQNNDPSPTRETRMSAQCIMHWVSQSPAGLDRPRMTRKCLKATQIPEFASCYRQSTQSVVRGRDHLWADHIPIARWRLSLWSVAGFGVVQLPRFPVSQGKQWGKNGGKV